MIDEEAKKWGQKCVSSTLWRWMPGMRGHDVNGPFVVDGTGWTHPSAWPDLRDIPTQAKAFFLLKTKLPEFEPAWIQENTWVLKKAVDTQDGGRYQPFARTLPELMSDIFWRWPKAGGQ